MKSDLSDPSAQSFSRPALGVALAVWAASTFGHGLGLEWAGAVFQWARQPDTWLSKAGGPLGVHRLELILASLFGIFALVVFGVLAVRVRRLQPPRRDLLDAVVPWVIWATCTYVIWNCFIVYATEMTHFVQYALVGWLVAWALDRGRRPQAAFLLTAGLGILDEIWQHYGLAWGDTSHWLDFTDPVLDALGAVGGILPFVTLARLRKDPLPSTWHLVKGTLAGASCVLLPLLLLAPVTVSVLLGHYSYYPFWGEYRNNKPTHWPGPAEGIPVMLIMLIVLGLIVEPRRRKLSQPALAVILVLVALAIQPASRRAGTPVHEVVPHARAHRTPQPIVIDGVLEEAWQRAERIGPFVRNKDGKPASVQTWARVLWDSKAIYFAFEVEDKDVWARDTHRDDRELPGDEVVEVFLDDGGDEVTYFEFEVSPKNVVQDLYCFVPAAPIDYDPSTPFRAMNAWSAPGLQTAVKVEGTLDVNTFWAENPAIDTDRGYVVEIALPWQDIAPYPAPAAGVAHRPVPPRPGDRWRLGLYRIEMRRQPAETGGSPSTVSQEEARKILGLTKSADKKRFDKYMRWAIKPGKDGRLRRRDVELLRVKREPENQAWAPTYHTSFHVPRFFGVLEFTE